VAGAAALFLAANPTATPAQVQAALVKGATPGKVRRAGPASPNRMLFTGVDAAKPPATPGTPSTPTPAPATCGAFTNGGNVAIPDRAVAYSPVTVANCAGTGSAKAKLTLTVKHSFRGDLVIDLIAPDGTVYRIKRGNSRDDSADVVGTSTLNLARENRNGIWKLRVRDTFRTDTGYVDSWTLAL
jgi:hypothetical protein